MEGTAVTMCLRALSARRFIRLQIKDAPLGRIATKLRDPQANQGAFFFGRSLLLANR